MDSIWNVEDSRGMALQYIINYLEEHFGLCQRDFINYFSAEKDGKSEKTLLRYMKGDSPMKKWTFEQFWNMVDSSVQQCFEYGDQKSLIPHASETWKQEKAKHEEICRFFFLDLNVSDRSEDFPESIRQLYIIDNKNKKELLDIIEPIFNALDESIAYSLQCNFSALAAVTSEDCLFWAHILTRTEEEKETLKGAMLQGHTVDAGTMLKYLQSEEVQCWVNLKNVDYSDTARKSNRIWGRFKDKVMDLPPWQFAAFSSLVEIFLVTVLNKSTPGAEKIEIKLPTADDIELLLLFKYCLAPNEREKLLES